ncbi:MAG TPA: FHA domain-containing protein [Acidimicrobiales bacterium]|nr:FHA domain-containing protein [Acidimicrobiales bacterium]
MGSRSSPSASNPSPADGGDPFAVPSLSLHVKTDSGRVIELEPGDRLIIGRTPESALSSVCGDNISFRHAEIYVSGESAFIVDTNSTNGTFIDGERLAPGMPQLLTGSVSVQLATTPPMHLSIDLQRIT